MYHWKLYSICLCTKTWVLWLVSSNKPRKRREYHSLGRMKCFREGWQTFVEQKACPSSQRSHSSWKGCWLQQKEQKNGWMFRQWELKVTTATLACGEAWGRLSYLMSSFRWFCVSSLVSVSLVQPFCFLPIRCFGVLFSFVTELPGLSSTDLRSLSFLRRLVLWIASSWNFIEFHGLGYIIVFFFYLILKRL